MMTVLIFREIYMLPSRVAALLHFWRPHRFKYDILSSGIGKVVMLLINKILSGFCECFYDNYAFVDVY